jgi:hypothetical protein
MDLSDFNRLSKPYTASPAKAGVRNYLKSLDTGLRRHDDISFLAAGGLVQQYGLQAGVSQTCDKDFAAPYNQQS